VGILIDVFVPQTSGKAVWKNPAHPSSRYVPGYLKLMSWQTSEFQLSSTLGTIMKQFLDRHLSSWLSSTLGIIMKQFLDRHLSYSYRPRLEQLWNYTLTDIWVPAIVHAWNSYETIHWQTSELHYKMTDIITPWDDATKKAPIGNAYRLFPIGALHKALLYDEATDGTGVSSAASLYFHLTFLCAALHHLEYLRPLW
jgi:hypothetical protein